MKLTQKEVARLTYGLHQTADSQERERESQSRTSGTQSSRCVCKFEQRSFKKYILPTYGKSRKFYSDFMSCCFNIFECKDISGTKFVRSQPRCVRYLSIWKDNATIRLAKGRVEKDTGALYAEADSVENEYKFSMKVGKRKAATLRQ